MPASFELVAFQIAAIENQIADEDLIETYSAILDANGWTRSAFEQELMNRVDEEWIRIYKQTCHSN